MTNDNLSEKIVPKGHFKKSDNIFLGSDMLWANDVRSAVKKLKEKLEAITGDSYSMIIDEIFGEDLI